MSRYPTKAEMIEVVKDTLVTDYNRLGTPKTLKAFNLTGIIRDLKPLGEYPYGWTFEVCDAEGFHRAIYNNIRPRYRAQVPTQAERRAMDAHQDEHVATIRSLLDTAGVCYCCGTDFTAAGDITPPRGPLPSTL